MRRRSRIQPASRQLGSYREFSPASDLQRFVSRYWTYTVIDWQWGSTVKILPDGSCDFVFSSAGISFSGPMTRPFVFVAQAGEKFLGIRFTPEGAAAFLRQDLFELRDTSTSVDEILTGEVRLSLTAIYRLWMDRVLTVGTLDVWVRSLPRHPVSPIVVRAVRETGSRGGAIAIETLAKSIGVTRQHLSRLMLRFVGLTPKEYGRIVAVHRDIQASFARITAPTPWVDESHRTKNYQKVTGCSPRAFLRTGLYEVPFLQSKAASLT